MTGQWFSSGAPHTECQSRDRRAERSCTPLAHAPGSAAGLCGISGGCSCCQRRLLAWYRLQHILTAEIHISRTGRSPELPSDTGFGRPQTELKLEWRVMNIRKKVLFYLWKTYYLYAKVRAVVYLLWWMPYVTSQCFSPDLTAALHKETLHTHHMLKQQAQQIMSWGLCIWELRKPPPSPTCTAVLLLLKPTCKSHGPVNPEAVFLPSRATLTLTNLKGAVMLQGVLGIQALQSGVWAEGGHCLLSSTVLQQPVEDHAGLLLDAALLRHQTV